jgi:ABC-2 type transport system ATP-binding protein
VLDEPTVGLDPAQIRDIRNLIRELGNSSSVILSTHMLSEVENVCDRVEIMHHGRLIYSDSSTHMMQYGDGKMKLEEVFLEITSNHSAGEHAP